MNPRTVPCRARSVLRANPRSSFRCTDQPSISSAVHSHGHALAYAARSRSTDSCLAMLAASRPRAVWKLRNPSNISVNSPAPWSGPGPLETSRSPLPLTVCGLPDPSTAPATPEDLRAGRNPKGQRHANANRGQPPKRRQPSRQPQELHLTPHPSPHRNGLRTARSKFGNDVGGQVAPGGDAVERGLAVAPGVAVADAGGDRHAQVGDGGAAGGDG